MCRVVECRIRDPEVPDSNAGGARRITLTGPIRTIHCQSLSTRVKYLKLYEVKIRSHCGTVVECRTTDPKENLSQVLSEQCHCQSLSTRVKCLTVSEVKIRSHCGTVVQYRTTDPEVFSSNPHDANRNTIKGSFRTIPPPIPLHHSDISQIVMDVKQKSLWHSGRVQTRDPEVPTSNSHDAKRRTFTMSIRSIPLPSFCTRFKYLKLWEVKSRFSVPQWESAGLQIWNSTVQILVQQKKHLNRSFQYNTTANSSALELNIWIVRCEKLISLWHSGKVHYYRSRRSQGQMVVGQKEKLSQVQTVQYYNQLPCTRVKYLKLSEVKSRFHCSKVGEYRTTD